MLERKLPLQKRRKLGFAQGADDLGKRAGLFRSEDLCHGRLSHGDGVFWVRAQGNFIQIAASAQNQYPLNSSLSQQRQSGFLTPAPGSARKDVLS